MNRANCLHIEVCCKQSVKRLEQLEEELSATVRQFLASKKPNFNTSIDIEEDSELYTDVVSLLIECFGRGEDETFTLTELEHAILHFYRPHQRDVELEMFDGGADGDAEAAAVPSSSHWLLPASAFNNLWENLIYEDSLKEKLLRYALSALLFSQRSVNRNIVACNRLILLHGPPGTGKTSLCKAIAQKLAIRIRPTYKFTHLIEINSHSLFSKWFSESGKLVMKLFAKIREIVAQPKSLVCVLMDEVESLAYARDNMSGQEPKDAMRVVNALLTQLDSIKDYPNVIILATSNLAKTIDLAFLDRADIKQYISLPSPCAIQQIYAGMLLELMRVGIVRKQDWDHSSGQQRIPPSIIEPSIGLSGRTLRKIPFLAHAIYSAESGMIENIALNDFLYAMEQALEKHRADLEMLKKPMNNINSLNI